MIIGVLAIQGAYMKHVETLNRLNISSRLIKTCDDLNEINGIIFPGGESTTIGKLLVNFGIDKILKQYILGGMPVFATCAGLILLAKKIKSYNQFSFNILDIEIERNAYGRQIESFETDLTLKNIGYVRGVFIRAPKITYTNSNINIIGTYKNSPVLIQQNNILASTFHPELTENCSIHEYFLTNIVQKFSNNQKKKHNVPIQ